MTDAKVLTLDIETAPHVADVWSLWDQNVGLSQVHQFTRVICWAAKWYGQKQVKFMSEYHNGFEQMIYGMYYLIDEADIVVHFNGARFDIPHLRREFWLQELPPPSPVVQIDLMKVAKREFRFASNKLAHITEQARLTGKLKHSGHEMWRACLDPDVDPLVKQRAWNLMRRYNKQDVVTTEELYDSFRPWISSHPHMGLFNEDGPNVCSRCGHDVLHRRGSAYVGLSKYQRYRCASCGAWSRGAKALARAEIRGIQ